MNKINENFSFSVSVHVKYLFFMPEETGIKIGNFNNHLEAVKLFLKVVFHFPDSYG